MIAAAALVFVDQDEKYDEEADGKSHIHKNDRSQAGNMTESPPGSPFTVQA